jgi:hypothetical protein
MASPPSFSCGYASVGASSAVENQIDLVNSYTNTTLSSALSAAAAIDEVVIQANSLSISMDDVAPIGITGPGSAPVLEEIDPLPAGYGDISFDPNDPPPVPGFDRKPDQPPDPPAPDDVDEPDFLTIGPILPLRDIDFDEDPPVFVPGATPPRPTLYNINLPTMPPLEELMFLGVRPSNVLPSAPTETFSFTEEAYSSTIVDAVRAKLLEIFNGGTGLPAAVAQALRDRANEAAQENANKALQQADEDWAQRGFGLPTGMLTSRRQEVQHELLKESGKLNRDIYIKEVDVQIDMLKQAMSTSVALEDVLIRLHISVQQRRLEAAQFLITSAIELFNARIAARNLETQIYLADVQVFRERIQAQIARVQRYQAEIEGQKLIGEINEQLVRMYVEEYRALEVNARVYTAQVEGFTAKINAKRGIIEAYVAQVTAERTKAEVNQALAQVFAEQVRAEGLKQENYKIRAETFAAAINGWSVGAQAELERYRGEISVIDSQTRVFLARIERIRTLLEVERTRITALSQNNEVQVQAYQVSSQATISQNEAITRHYIANIERVRAEAQIAIQNGQINIENALNVSNLTLRQKETIAQVYSNLVASFASAVNISAGISDQASTSQSCTTDVSYNTSF